MDIDAIRRSYRKQTMRTPAAWRFDRNCVLSTVAGQLIAAAALKVPVKAVVVGESSFDVGPVAKDIVLEAPGFDADTAVIASAGIVGFLWAAGLPIEEEGNSPTIQLTMYRAATLLTSSVEDGSYAALVRALDQLKVAGERSLHAG